MNKFTITLLFIWATVVLVGLVGSIIEMAAEEIVPWLFDDQHQLDLPDTREALLFTIGLLLWPFVLLAFVMFILTTENRWVKARRRRKRVAK